MPRLPTDSDPIDAVKLQFVTKDLSRDDQGDDKDDDEVSWNNLSFINHKHTFNNPSCGQWVNILGLWRR